MNSKIKSTLNFVKLWPTQNKREEVPFVIFSDSIDEAAHDISKIVNTHNAIEIDNAGNILHQCYLKSVEQIEIHKAEIFDKTKINFTLSSDDILKFISSNNVKLIPTTQTWVTENGDLAHFVTHDVYIDNCEYVGMSIADCVYKHLSKTKEK